MQRKLCFIFALLLAVACLSQVQAQQALVPRASPFQVTTTKFGDAYFKITYCRPHKNGRSVFGGIVPYGKVWRTGANEATEFTVTKAIKLGGKKLKPGTYTLFTIPYEDHWTIILNSELGQWGSFNYKPELDVLKVDVPVTKNTVVYEPFTIEFELKDAGGNIILMWDDVKVAVPFSF